MFDSQKSNSLSEGGVYPCPVCRCGEVRAMPLMEAMNCNTCYHIFTPFWERQRIALADSEIPLTWYWNGRRWKQASREGFTPHWGYGLAAFLFVSLPTTMMGFSAYLFPPLPGSKLAWLPIFWTVVVFFTHLFCLLWLAIAYYQFPVFLYLRTIARRR